MKGPLILSGEESETAVSQGKEGREVIRSGCVFQPVPSLPSSFTVMGSWLLKITREEGGQTHGEEIDNQDTRTWLWRLESYIRALVVVCIRSLMKIENSVRSI